MKKLTEKEKNSIKSEILLAANNIKKHSNDVKEIIEKTGEFKAPEF